MRPISRRRRAQPPADIEPDCPYAAALPPLAPFSDSSGDRSGDRSEGRGYPGFYIGSAAAYHGHQALVKLKQISNASSDEFLALVESINAVCTLGSELMKIDLELASSSDGELGRLLSEIHNWETSHWDFHGGAANFQYSVDGRGICIPFSGEKRRTEQSLVASAESRAKEWIENNVPAEQIAAFTMLLERRSELRKVARQAQQGLEELVAQIDEAQRKSKIVAAAERLDPTVGIAGESGAALESVAKAKAGLSAVNAGLDEAYRIAVSRQLEPALFAD